MSLSAPYAFIRNVNAYDTFPLEERYRRQLPLSLMSMLTMKDQEVRVDDVAADRVYEIGLTADGASPGHMIGRGLYLMNVDRNPEEVDALALKLRQTAAHQGQVQNFLRVYEEWTQCGKKRCSARLSPH